MSLEGGGESRGERHGSLEQGVSHGTDHSQVKLQKFIEDSVELRELIGEMESKSKYFDPTRLPVFVENWNRQHPNWNPGEYVQDRRYCKSSEILVIMMDKEGNVQLQLDRQGSRI